MIRRTNLQSILYLRLLILVTGTIGCSFVTNRLSSRIKQPSTSETSGVIVYVGTDGNIHTIDQNGEQERLVTHDAGEDNLSYLYPTWSPDSRRISYLAIKLISGVEQESTLYTVNREGQQAKQIYRSTQDSPFYFYWSPDSEKISFLSATTSGNELSLSLVPARGGEVQTLGFGQPFYWDWSPDSQSIFIHTGGSAQSNPDAMLALLVPGETLQQTELDLHPGAFQAPAWSPHGEELLITTESGGDQEALMLIDPAGKIIRTVDETAGPQAFAWSPDASRIALLHSANDTSGLLRGLKLLDPQAPGDKQEVISEDTVAFFWSPDSRKIAYLQPVFSSPQPDVQGVAQTRPQVLLSLMIYNLDSKSTHQAALFNPTDEFLNLIPFFDQYHRSITLWSPDSQHLVLSANEDSGSSSIYVVDASGDEDSVRIADGNLAFWSWK